jgi:hypothetical protein
LLASLFAVVLCATVPARAADRIKVGFSMALTGAVAPQSPESRRARECGIFCVSDLRRTAQMWTHLGSQPGLPFPGYLSHRVPNCRAADSRCFE